MRKTIYSLRRCPFCNSHALVLDRQGFCSFVRCKSCGATGSNGVGPDETKSAVELWNGTPNKFGWTSMVVEGEFGNRNDTVDIEV